MRFTHDVLVCFGRGRIADGTVDLTRWSTQLIDAIDAETNRPTFSQEPRDRVTFARGDGGEERPALLLVLLSPTLLADPVRLAEIERFRQSAATDGRTAEHTIVATIMPAPLPPQRVAALDWLLRHGKRANGDDGFYDAAGLPVHAPIDVVADWFIALETAILSLVGEIQSKLRVLQRRMPERFGPPPPPPPPDVGGIQLAAAIGPPIDASLGGADIPVLPQLYLASASDVQRWTEAYAALKPMAVVNPAQMGEMDYSPANRRQRDELRRRFLLRCNGLVLIRAAADDQTDLLVSDALYDIRVLRQEESDWQTPLWVLVDWVDDAGPALQHVAPPRVSALRSDWADGVRRTLRL